MGRPGHPRSGSSGTPPAPARRDGGDGRLDPVRWRRPGRGTLARLSVVAILLLTAAVLAWSPPPPCASTPGAVRLSVAPTVTDPVATPAPQSPDAPSPAVPTGRVGVPVRLADPTALALVRPGQRVDLLRIDSVDGDGDGAPVATDALVLTVTAADDLTPGGLLLALSPAEATRALSRPGDGFAVLIRPG